MRGRAWRRSQTERYKAKQLRDFKTTIATSRAISYEPRFLSATRHHLDCGKTCLMCHGEKILDGHTRERQEAQRMIATEIVNA